MPKRTLIAFRADTGTRQALEAAAVAQGRTLSALLTKIIEGWLTQNVRKRGKWKVATSQSDSFTQGLDAYRDHADIGDCPYSVGTKRHANWIRGWHAGQLRGQRRVSRSVSSR